MTWVLLAFLQDPPSIEWKPYKKDDRLTMTWTFEQTYKGFEGKRKIEYRDIREVDAVLIGTGDNQFKVEIKSAKWRYTPDGEHRITLTMDASGDIREEENTMHDPKAVREKFSAWLKRDYTWAAGLNTPSPWVWGSGAINGLFDWMYSGELDAEYKLTPDTSWKRKLSSQESWLPAFYAMSEHKNKMVCRVSKENDQLSFDGAYKLDHSKPYSIGSCTGTESITHQVHNEFKVRKTGLPLWTQSEIKSLVKRETTEDIFSYEYDYVNRQSLLIRE